MAAQYVEWGEATRGPRRTPHRFRSAAYPGEPPSDPTRPFAPARPRGGRPRPRAALSATPANTSRGALNGRHGLAHGSTDGVERVPHHPARPEPRPGHQSPAVARPRGTQRSLERTLHAPEQGPPAAAWRAARATRGRAPPAPTRARAR